MERAYIALGSNLGDSVQILTEAMKRLAELSDQPLLLSSLWATSPVDCPPGSPDFVNAVVGLVPRASETPASLLEKLQALEKEFGRRPKKVMNEARPLDLDIIVFGDEERNTAALVVPHPRAHLRQFVLVPLAEIAPELVLVGQGKTVRELSEGLRTGEQIRRLS
ncbi:MAG TPA: 2-amino-4-hydroxy-6-hydroxymethyldihydropteridine diphosphokinase [Verrucomicrobiae bacterium]